MDRCQALTKSGTQCGKMANFAVEKRFKNVSGKNKLFIGDEIPKLTRQDLKERISDDNVLWMQPGEPLYLLDENNNEREVCCIHFNIAASRKPYDHAYPGLVEL